MRFPLPRRLAAALLLAAATAALASALPEIRGTNGDDTIDADYDPPTTNDSERIVALNGNDVVKAGGGDDRIMGGEGNDRLEGEGGQDLIRGHGGHDHLYGGDHDDDLDSGQGNDQLYGGAGNDHLKGNAQWDYLDGNEGEDVLDGGSDGDILIGRDGNDTLIGGPGDDILVVIGSSTEGYTIKGDAANDTGTGDNLLLFAGNWNPQVVQYIEIRGLGYLEVTSFSGRTNEPVTVDLATLSHIDTVVTGTADDTVTGADRTTGFTYLRRFQDSNGDGLQVHELLLTGPGNDTIRTRNGDDYVDAEDGDDTIHLGAGECYILTGPGNDTMIWEAANFDGTYNKDSVVADMEPGDTIRLTGNLAVEAVTLAQGQDGTVVSVNGEEEIRLLGIVQEQVQVQAASGAVEITVGAPPAGRGAKKMRAQQRRLFEAQRKAAEEFRKKAGKTRKKLRR